MRGESHTIDRIARREVRKARLDDNGSHGRRVQTDSFPRTVGIGTALCSHVSACTAIHSRWRKKLKEATTRVDQLWYDGERRAEAKTLGGGGRLAQRPAGLDPWALAMTSMLLSLPSTVPPSKSGSALYKSVCPRSHVSASDGAHSDPGCVVNSAILSIRTLQRFLIS